MHLKEANKALEHCSAMWRDVDWTCRRQLKKAAIGRRAFQGFHEAIRNEINDMTE